MRNRFIVATLLTLALLLPGNAFAQIPQEADAEATAAALTLTAEDLPTGYSLTGETFLPLPDATQVPGVQANYVSVYTNTENGQQIRSYVYTFENEDQAKAGIEVIEGNEAETLKDESVELGSGNAELTTGTYERADGSVVGTADVTFVRGNAVIGVAVDHPDGSAPDSTLATDLAKRADERAQKVQAGDSGIDLSLPGKIVPFTDGGTVLQAGFLSPAESEAVYGTQGSALTSLTSTYVKSVGYGENGAAPRVTIGVTTFASPEEAKSVVEQSDRIFTTMADQEKVADVEIEGTDSVAAFRYTSRDGASGSRESYRLIFSVGDVVTVVDVQGAPDSATAESAAQSIVAAQIGCQGGGTCERPVAEGVIPGN